MSRTMVDIESNKTCISIGSPPESPISLKSSCVKTFIPLYNAPSPVEKFTWPENRSESLSWHLFVSFFAMDGKEFVTNIGFQRFIKTDKIYSTDWFQKRPQSLSLSFYLYGLCKTNKSWLLIHIEFLFTMRAHVLFSIYHILKHWIALKARSDWLLKFRLSFANHFWNHIFVLYYLSVLVYTNAITSQYWWWAVDIYFAVVRLCKYHSLANYASVNSC